jgi:hypothetical protein
MEDGAEEIAGQERAYDCHNDVDQQVRAVVHDFSRHPADYCGYNQVNDNIHFYSPYGIIQVARKPCMFF